MLFITNREPKGSIRTKKGRVYKFDLNKNAPSNSIYCCERLAEDNYIEIGAEVLMSRLKESSARQLLFFIHGFSNLPEPDIFPRVAKLQEYFDAKEQDFVQVVPVIWPCDNDKGIVKDYWDDQKSADKSAFSFARALQFFMAWRDKESEDSPCTKRINILAHSMGNRVFRETISVWNKYDLANGVPLLFRNTILMAADIVNESLEQDQGGRLISQASRNVSVYYASDDLALRSSKISNLKNKVASRRLGHTGPESMKKVQSNVYGIDCDNFNNKYDFPKGHSYFLNDKNDNIGEVFEHMFNTIKTGRVLVDDKVNRKHIL
ncbi:MAG: alpha/beta hydrolase [Gammaproteobacteria bacterium]|nr:alpha/beta hydrolase [Gammaproteobacteria bacterium]